jgi:hypothetical protein
MFPLGFDEKYMIKNAAKVARKTVKNNRFLNRPGMMRKKTFTEIKPSRIKRLERNAFSSFSLWLYRLNTKKNPIKIKKEISPRNIKKFML